MRLWHKDLLYALPKTLLLQQWRDCCRLAREIAQEGQPCGKRVQRVMDFPLSHLRAYTVLVQEECLWRGCRIRPQCFWRYFPEMNPVVLVLPRHSERIFPGWHNAQYKRECLQELKEKYKQEHDLLRGYERFIQESEGRYYASSRTSDCLVVPSRPRRGWDAL